MFFSLPQRQNPQPLLKNHYWVLTSCVLETGHAGPRTRRSSGERVLSDSTVSDTDTRSPVGPGRGITEQAGNRSRKVTLAGKESQKVGLGEWMRVGVHVCQCVCMCLLCKLLYAHYLCVYMCVCMCIHVCTFMLREG